MAARMIRVRSLDSGLEQLVSEKAYGLFAAHYERLDQPAQSAPAAPPEDAKPSKTAKAADK